MGGVQWAGGGLGKINPCHRVPNFSRFPALECSPLIAFHPPSSSAFQQSKGAAGRDRKGKAGKISADGLYKI